MPEDTSIETKVWDKSSTEFVQERVPSIYINSANVMFSNWDASINFGEILGEVEGKLVVVPKLRVTMSLQHAKAFLKVLKDNLEAFEQHFGEIQLIEPKESPTAKENEAAKE